MMSNPLREVARVVVLDAASNVLLVRYEDQEPKNPGGAGALRYWVPPGGALNSGESYQEAAARELEEETGLTAEIGPMLWEKEHPLRFQGETVIQQEKYFLGRIGKVCPAVFNRTSEAILEHRWWGMSDLRLSSETFFPEGFIELVGAVVEGEIPSDPIGI